MKLYVEEQDMPPNCAECKAEGHYENSYGDEYGFFCPFGYKAYTSGTRDTKRLDDCPLVPIPPHGRCIDVDAVSLDGGPYMYDEWCEWAFEQFLNAPTIIPASKEGET